VNGSAGPWTRIWRRYATSDRGPKTALIDLSPYAGLNNIMLRFRYYNANFDWWWQIDDVNVFSCDPLPGGLVAGNIYDGATSLPLNGAVVSNDNGISATSLGTPDDANVDDGFYTIFSADGMHPFTATMDGFTPENASLNVISSNTIEHDFILHPPLETDFYASPTSGCPPLTVNFTDISTGTVTSWLWNFGDGITDTLQNPSHIYSLNGVYTVTLTISGPAGTVQEEKSEYITVAYLPEASFWASPTIGIAPETVNFTDTSTGTISTWMWDFGDGITSTFQSPSHLYTLDGVFTVTLSLTGPIGSDLEEKPGYITIYGVPIADFSASTTFGHPPLTIDFMDDSAGTVNSWLWDFGDGITSTLQSPSHIYSLDGVYTVSLTASGPAGNDREEKLGYIRIGYGSYLPGIIKEMLTAAGFP
jgi:PKD repeat protein